MNKGSSMLSPSNFISANEQQVAAKVMDGEAILINLGTGIYYSRAPRAGSSGRWWKSGPPSRLSLAA